MKIKKIDHSLPVSKVSELPDKPKCSISLPLVCSAKSKIMLTKFCDSKLSEYAKDRDTPSLDATSNLSTALALGTISTAECYQFATLERLGKTNKWVDELIWRDFYRSVVWHYPHVCQHKAFKPIDEYLNWISHSKEIEKFFQAKTGIPIIDAAVRQLLNTGWMHNRLRMITASYFTKNLWGNWRMGERFFCSASIRL